MEEGQNWGRGFWATFSIYGIGKWRSFYSLGYKKLKFELQPFYLKLTFCKSKQFACEDRRQRRSINIALERDNKV